MRLSGFPGAVEAVGLMPVDLFKALPGGGFCTEFVLSGFSERMVSDATWGLQTGDGCASAWLR